jgi:hypothetical protein
MKVDETSMADASALSVQGTAQKRRISLMKLFESVKDCTEVVYGDVGLCWCKREKPVGTRLIYALG